MSDTFQSAEISISKLIGVPFVYGQDGLDGIDCIHLVYRVLQHYKVPTPDFDPTWYESSYRVHIRSLRNWGKRVRGNLYNGDVIWITGDTPTFAVVWQQGILYISEARKAVHWLPISEFKDIKAFRYCPTSTS